MFRKLFLFIFLCSLSTAAFSLDHYKMVFDDIKEGKEAKILKELNEGNTTNLSSLSQLGMNYIELAHNFSLKNCKKVYKINELVSSWKDHFVLTEDIYYNEYDEEKEYNDSLSYRCKKVDYADINYFIKPKLVDKGLSLIRIAILNGDLNAVRLLIDLKDSDKIPYGYVINLIECLKTDNEINVNQYASFLIGQEYLTSPQIDPTSALQQFANAKDIDDPSLSYFIAYAKIEKLIEDLLDNKYSFSDEDYKHENKIIDKDTLENIQEKASRGNIKSLLYLSKYYVNEVKLNKALMYFNQACSLASSRACEMYQLQFKLSENREFYTLLEKFDKDTLDPEIAIAIAKWCESHNKYLAAIYFYSHVADNNPQLFLHIADLYPKTELFTSEKDAEILKNYIKYVNYVKSPKIMEKIAFKYDDDSNLDQKIYWLEAAANAGSFSSKQTLSEMYMKGDYVTQNYDKAIYWHQRYCFDEQDGYTWGSCIALNKLKQDPQLQRALDNGDMEAQYKVGSMFIEHTTLYEIGVDLLEKAAKQGHSSAELRLILNRSKRSDLNFSQ